MMQTWKQHNNIFSINASDINIGIRPGEHIELPGITVTIKVWREKLDMYDKKILFWETTVAGNRYIIYNQ